MVNFGKEDLSIIDEKLFIDRIIKKPFLSGVKIPDEVLKIIHFSEEKSSNRLNYNYLTSF